MGNYSKLKRNLSNSFLNPCPPFPPSHNVFPLTDIAGFHIGKSFASMSGTYSEIKSTYMGALFFSL